MQRLFNLKILVIGALCVCFAIGLAFVHRLVNERQNYADMVMSQIERESIGKQQVVSPFIVVPYLVQEPCVNDPKQTCNYQRILTLTAKTQDWKNQVQVFNNEHARGIYRAITYRNQIDITGQFEPSKKLINSAAYQSAQWDKAQMILPMSDLRGMIDTPSITINQQKYMFETVDEDTELKLPYQYVSVQIGSIAKEQLQFSTHFSIRGLGQLAIQPVGQYAKVHFQTPWKDIKYEGILPNQKSPTAKGTSAEWSNNYVYKQNIITLNSNINTPNQTTGLNAVIINFVDAVNIYTLTDRTIKYGLLLITITFGTFFLFEILKDLRIHPIQYVLVGAAQVIFYVLVLAFSEQFSFMLAYLGASIACIGLISWYMSYVLQGFRRVLSLFVILSGMYSVIYILLNAQHNTFMMGAVLMFILIATVMFLTRHVDWYGKGNTFPQPIQLPKL